MTIKRVQKMNDTSYSVIFDQRINKNGKQTRKIVGGFKSREEVQNFLYSTVRTEGSKIKKLYEPKTSKSYKVQAWNDLEVQQFLKSAKDTNNGLLYELSLVAGLRLGEVTSLTWSDVNFHEKTLTVNKTSTGFNRNPILMLRCGKRTISLSKQIITKLAAHKKQQEQLNVELAKDYQNKFNLVFTNKGGGVINPLIVQGQFKKFVKKSGVREITFHGLRITHANL